MWPFSRKKPVETPRRRSFDAAMINRLTSSWGATSQSIDWDLSKSLNVLRARSRDLCTNNDYAKKFLQMTATHVVGPSGFVLQVRITETDAKGKQKTDDLANAAIEAAFYEWARRGNCDVTGLHSFFDICNLYIKAMARDGEVLIRKVYGKQMGKFGFALQMLDIDRLDVSYNDKPRGGNIIKMGVELNQYGRPVAYHLRQSHPGDNPYYTYQGKIYERVPAEDIYHHFISERPEQNRGAPWMHASMARLQNLGGYEEAAVIAARVGAAKMGFYTTPEGDGTALSDGTDDTGALFTDAEAGVFGVLPPGYDFKSFDPDYPHQMFAEFVKSNLRGISSGLGVAYNTLSNDLEGVNFSSIRTGVLEERDNWMMIQKFVIENWLDDLFSTWLKWALISSAIKLPNGASLPASKFDKFNAATWIGRRWQWVDPFKDIQANVAAINNGLKSRSDVVAEQGRDFGDTITQLAAEQAQMAALGIKIEQPAGMVDDSEDENQPPVKAD